MKYCLVILAAIIGAASFAAGALAESKPAAEIVPPKYEHLPAREYHYRKTGRDRTGVMPPLLIQKIDVLDDTRMSSGEIAIPDVPRPTFKRYPARE